MQLRVYVTVKVKEQKKKKHRPPALILWTFGAPQEQHTPAPIFGAAMTRLTETQQVSGVVRPVTRRGNAAEVQDSRFESSNPAVLEVVSDPTNPLAVTAKAVAPGAAQLHWRADADLGDGVVEITATEDFVVTAGQAVGASFSFGSPEEQPEAPPV